MAILTLSQLKNNVPPATTGRIVSMSDIQREEQLRQDISGNRFEKEKPTTFLGKVRDIATNIIGGGELARGAGMALASPFVSKTMEETRQFTEQTQSALLQKIKEKREKGENTSKLEKALKDTQTTLTSLADVASDFAEALPSNKQVIGSSARLATTLGAGAIFRGASKAFALGKSTTFLSGLARGAGMGAVTGAVVGGLQGAGVGMEQDKDLSEIATDALIGITVGGAGGAILGGITGGIGGALRGRTVRKEEFVRQLVSPRQTRDIRSEAIRQGRLKDPTFFEKAEIAASKRDEQIAEVVKNVVKPKATIGQNVDALRLKISQVSDGVEDYVTKNKVPFNTNQLRSYLMRGSDDLELVFASDTNAQNLYNKTVEALIKQVNIKDTAGLLSGRKGFDHLPAIQKLLNSSALGENAKKEIVHTVRQMANEYIASLLPKGNAYRADLLQQHLMIEALENVSDKFASIVGYNRLQLLTREYPILKWLVGGIAAGIAGGAGIGVGSTIIGSSE